MTLYSKMEIDWKYKIEIYAAMENGEKRRERSLRSIILIINSWYQKWDFPTTIQESILILSLSSRPAWRICIGGGKDSKFKAWFRLGKFWPPLRFEFGLWFNLFKLCGLVEEFLISATLLPLCSNDGQTITNLLDSNAKDCSLNQNQRGSNLKKKLILDFQLLRLELI